MAIHLFIVAQEDNFLDPFKTAYERASAPQPVEGFVARTCKSPNDLLAVVRAAVLQARQHVHTLDIFGHGSAGFQYLGKDVLFGVSNGALTTGAGIAQGLRRFLTPDARIRLLGCVTAVGESGRALLLSLREELGGSVTVYGTVASLNARPRPPHGGIDDGEFDERGFKAVKDDDWLFSSSEARRRLAPTQDELANLNREWFKGIEKD